MVVPRGYGNRARRMAEENIMARQLLASRRRLPPMARSPFTVANCRTRSYFIMDAPDPRAYIEQMAYLQGRNGRVGLRDLEPGLAEPPFLLTIRNELLATVPYIACLFAVMVVLWLTIAACFHLGRVVDFVYWCTGQERPKPYQDMSRPEMFLEYMRSCWETIWLKLQMFVNFYLKT